MGETYACTDGAEHSRRSFYITWEDHIGAEGSSRVFKMPSIPVSGMYAGDLDNGTLAIHVAA